MYESYRAFIMRDLHQHKKGRPDLTLVISMREKNERKGFFPCRKNTINTSTLLTGVRKSKQNENMFFFPRISERRVINILELMAQRRGFEGLLMLEQVIAIQSP